MDIDLKRLGVILANYSAMVFVAAFAFSAIGMFAGLGAGQIGSLPVIGWIGYLLGPIAYFAYRHHKSAGEESYDQQIELFGLIGSIVLSPLLGILLGAVLYLIGRFG